MSIKKLITKEYLGQNGYYRMSAFDPKQTFILDSTVNGGSCLTFKDNST